MKQIVLIRHGQSEWNKKKLFTGWTDIDLSEKGKREAQKAGAVLREKGFEFDMAITSYLKRAIRTLWYVLDELDMMWLPVERDWRLNERHYGALQGKNKEEMKKVHGEEQVHEWRRSYSTRPPLLEESDHRLPDQELKYKGIGQLPRGESLSDTRKRVLQFWEEKIESRAQEIDSLLITAHGNSLRSLVMLLEGIEEDKIAELEIPTGNPFVYEFDSNLKPKGERRYLL